MSNYYKYKFITPHRLYARVKEQLDSYFSTGAVDDLMFPIWTEDCIDKFRKTFYPIRETALCIKEGKAELPEDYKAIREAWATTSQQSNPFITGGSLYYGKDYQTITLTDTAVEGSGLEIQVENYAITRKVTRQQVYNYTRSFLLQPGNVQQEDGYIINYDFRSTAPVYSIEGNCFQTNFPDGIVHIVYYSDGTDEEGYQLIPDEPTMKRYIEAYLTYMIMLKLFNQTTDDTFRQMQIKLEMADKTLSEAFIRADTESKSETLARKMQKIKNSYRRHSRYRM